MNITYIGPYRQNDGWGLAARDYLKALLTIPDAIVNCRPSITNPSSICTDKDLSPEILDSEMRSNQDKTDFIIQKCMIEGCGLYREAGAKSILLTVFENENIKTALNKIYSRFDKILVPCSMNQKAILDLNPETFVVSQPIDTQLIIENQESRLKLNNNTYKFYVVAENNERKNIEDTIFAFLLEFDPIVDQVELIIKSNISEEVLKNMIKEMQKSIKYKSFTSESYIKVIPERLSEQAMIGLHNSCDCFITTSHGEAFCRGAAEALCCGNRIIIHDNIGIIDFVDEEDYEHIQVSSEPVFLKHYQSLQSLDIYSSEEMWANPSLTSIQNQMRKAYQQNMGVDREKYLEEFNYKKIGEKICHSFT